MTCLHYRNKFLINLILWHFPHRFERWFSRLDLTDGCGPQQSRFIITRKAHHISGFEADFHGNQIKDLAVRHQENDTASKCI